MKEALDRICLMIASRSTNLIATANAEMIETAQSDPELAAALQFANLVVPDGAGVVWAARYVGQPVPERVAGYDLVQELIKVAGEKQYRIFWFGSAQGIADAASEKAKNSAAGLVVAGTRDGYFSSDQESNVVEQIRATAPDILLVALGAPRQEKWLHRHLSALNVPVCIGVGGTFDVMAGRVQRAPLWMQQAGLEWFYRLAMQPSRFIRMLALPRFVFRVVKAGKHRDD